MPSIYEFSAPDHVTANMKMVAIQTEIACYAVGMVTVNSHHSCLTDEGLAHRIGLCPIVQSKLTPQTVGSLVIEAKPGRGVITEVTTDDIVGIPFAQKTPLVTLVQNERIELTLHLAKSVPTVHTKWACVAAPVLLAGEDDNQWFIEYENLGQFTDAELKVILDGIAEPERLPTTNMYTRIMYPS